MYFSGPDGNFAGITKASQASAFLKSHPGYTPGLQHVWTPPPHQVSINPNDDQSKQLTDALGQGGVPVTDGTNSDYIHYSKLQNFLAQNPSYEKGTVLSGPDGKFAGVVKASQVGAYLQKHQGYQAGLPLPPDSTAAKVGQFMEQNEQLNPWMSVPALQIMQKTAVTPFLRMAQAGHEAIARRAERAAAAFVIPSPPVGQEGATEEQKQQAVQQLRTDYPMVAGAARGFGGAAGAMAADPRMWPLMFSGQALPVMQRLMSAGFTVQMLKGAYDENHVMRTAAENGDVLGTAEAAAEFATDSYFAGKSTIHTVVPVLQNTINIARIAGADRLRQSAENQLQRVLLQGGGTKKEKAIAQNIAPEMAQRGLFAWSRAGLEEKSAEQANVAGKNLEDFYQGLPQNSTIPTQPLIEHFDQQKQNFIAPDSGAVLDQNALDKIDAMKQIVQQFGPDVTVKDIVTLRRIWDDQIAASREGHVLQPVDESTHMALQGDAADAIRAELAKQYPDLDKLNKEFSFWKNVNTVMSATNLRKGGHAWLSMQDLLFGLGGAGGGFLGEGHAGAGAGGAGAAVLLSKAIKSTAWNTLSAGAKYRVADLLAAGKTRQAARVVAQQLNIPFPEGPLWDIQQTPGQRPLPSQRQGVLPFGQYQMPPSSTQQPPGPQPALPSAQGIQLPPSSLAPQQALPPAPARPQLPGEGPPQLRPQLTPGAEPPVTTAPSRLLGFNPMQLPESISGPREAEEAAAARGTNWVPPWQIARTAPSPAEVATEAAGTQGPEAQGSEGVGPSLESAGLPGLHPSRTTRPWDIVQSAEDMNPRLDEGAANRAATVHLDDDAKHVLDGGLGLGSNWDGKNLQVQSGQRLSQNLRSMANKLKVNGEAKAAQNVLNLADQVDRALALNYDPNAGHAGLPLVHDPGSTAHEAVTHAGQRALAGRSGDIRTFTDLSRTLTDPNDPTGAAVHPAVEKATQTLQQWGYNVNEPAVIAAEMQAHILDGRYEKLGLTREEAVDWMKHSYDVLSQHHGPDVMENLPRLAQGYVDAVKNFIGDQGETGATANTTAAAEAGRTAQTPHAGGAGPSLPENAPAGEAAEGAGLRGNRAPNTKEVGPSLEARRVPQTEEERTQGFISPNRFAGMTPEEAQVRQRSMTHQAFTKYSNELHAALGLQPKTSTAFGVSPESGAENALVNDFQKLTPQQRERARYAQIVLAKDANQGGALTFHHGADGADSMYRFTVKPNAPGMIANIDPKNPIEGISRNLNEEGIPYHTITPVKGGYEVSVFDKNSQLTDNVDRAADRFNVPDIRDSRGQGLYDEQSDFNRIIAEHEARDPEAASTHTASRNWDSLRNFSNLSNRAITGGPVTQLEHASPQELLTKVSPEMQGTNPARSRGAEWKRIGAYPEETPQRSYFHVQGQPGWEKAYSSLPFHYTGQVPSENLYPLESDPDNLMAGARTEAERRGNYPGLSTSLYEQAVKRAGYDGFVTQGGDVAMFRDLGVKANNLREFKDSLTQEAQRALTSPEDQKRFKEIYNSLDPNALKEAAQVGHSQMLWYERSSALYDALNRAAPDLFPSQLRDKFFDFVSSLSPRQLVSENAHMAIDPWVDYVKQSAKGSANVNKIYSNLEAQGVKMRGRLQNAVRALVNEPLSGFKVSDFAESLQGNNNPRSVIDGIMNIFGAKNLDLSDPAAYYAYATRVAEGAKDLNWRSGQAQAAIWAWTEHFLSDLYSRKPGQGRVVKPGLTPEGVATQITPSAVAAQARGGDFVDVFRDHPKVRSKLAEHLGSAGMKQLDNEIGQIDRNIPKPQASNVAPILKYLPQHARRIHEAIQQAKEEE